MYIYIYIYIYILYILTNLKLLKKSENIVDESVNLVSIFHPALNCVNEKLRKAHHHVMKSNRYYHPLHELHFVTLNL